jgi:hypothetical protein
MVKIKNVNLIAILGIVLVAFMTVGYAYVNDNQVTLAGDVQKSWNVGLNTEEYTSNGDAKDISEPVISKNNIKFSVGFTKSGQYKTYNFQVLNKGDINAVLSKVKVIADSYNVPGVTFDYTVYKENNIITSNANPSINMQYNHLYRTYGTNMVEVTIMYNGAEIQDEANPVVAEYEFDLVYTQDE